MTRKSQRRRSGFTLIELLVAISLLSLLSVGMLMAMRVGLNALERSTGRLMDNRRATGVQRIIDQQISGIIPVLGTCQTGPAPNAPKFLFFQGDSQSMRVVSSYSLEEGQRGYPRILEYLVAPSPGGGVRLLVNEIPYAGPYSVAMLCTGSMVNSGGRPVPQLRPVQPGPRSFVLADGLAHCRFQYLKDDPRQRSRQWIPVWETGPGPGLPVAIRIEMMPLRNDPGKVQLATMTLPVHANRDPYFDYQDYEPPPQQQ